MSPVKQSQISKRWCASKFSLDIGFLAKIITCGCFTLFVSYASATLAMACLAPTRPGLKSSIFGFVGTVIMMIVVTDLLDKVTRFWVDLTTARRKKDRIDAQIANGNRSSFGKHLRVRLASQSDRSAMCKLVVTNHLALSDDCPVEWTEQLCDIPEDYGHLIDADRFSLGHYRVAEYVDKNGVSNLAGVVGIVPKGHKKDKKKNPSTWVLTALSVNAECRGRGVGEQLLQAIISDARDIFSLRRLELETLKERMEPAWRLYEKVGFEKSDEVVAYPAEGHRKRSMTVYHYSLDL